MKRTNAALRSVTVKFRSSEIYGEDVVEAKRLRGQLAAHSCMEYLNDIMRSNKGKALFVLRGGENNRGRGGVGKSSRRRRGTDQKAFDAKCEWMRVDRPSLHSNLTFLWSCRPYAMLCSAVCRDAEMQKGKETRSIVSYSFIYLFIYLFIVLIVRRGNPSSHDDGLLAAFHIS